MSPDENLTSAEIIERFNHFYDCWLDSITVTYAKGTAVRLRFCAVDWNHVDGGWEKAANDDVWRHVTVTLENISDYRVQARSSAYAAEFILSNGTAKSGSTSKDITTTPKPSRTSPRQTYTLSPKAPPGSWARSACTAVRAREPLHWKHD